MYRVLIVFRDVWLFSFHTHVARHAFNMKAASPLESESEMINAHAAQAAAALQKHLQPSSCAVESLF